MSSNGKAPNPNWKPGDPTSTPVRKMVSLEMDQLDITSRYKLLIGSILPRPIAWVSTISAEGAVNLAPFSFFNGVASNPPSVMIAIVRKPDGSSKDTLANILATRQFVVNTVAEWNTEPMNYTSAPLPHGHNEMEAAGLTAIPSVRVKPPRVQESPIHMECELLDTLAVGDGGIGSSTIVVGKIVLMHVHEPAYREGKLLIEELRPISRLAGLSYGRTSGIFDLPRP